MKALTLYQPWAHLVAIGAKRIETRSWRTSYRGPLAIHAGVNTKYVSSRSKDYICGDEPFRSLLPPAIEFGVIVAVCELVACASLDGHQLSFQKGSTTWLLTAQELDFGDYTPGRYAWLLANVKPLANPIPAKGSLGLWDFNQLLPDGFPL